MTYREKLMKLSIGKVVEFNYNNTTGYGHIVGFDNCINRAENVTIVISCGDAYYDKTLDEIEL